VPRLPTIDQLANHGSMAFLKRQEAKSPRTRHECFCAQIKYFRGVKLISVHLNKFPRTVNKFPRTVNKFPCTVNKFLRRSICFRAEVKSFRADKNISGGHKTVSAWSSDFPQDINNI